MRSSVTAGCPSNVDDLLLDRSADVFGRLLLRCHAAGGKPGIVQETTERDDGLRAVRDVAGYFTPVATNSLEGQVLRRATGRVLDIACGAGRHLRHLRDHGLDALGLDPSVGAAQVCAARGLDAVHGSIYLPPAIGAFDTLLMMGGKLDLLAGPDTAPVLLRTLADLATPGARILAEGLDPASSDPRQTSYQARNRQRGLPAGQVTVRLCDGDVAGEWQRLWSMSSDELSQVVTGSPWQVADAWPHATGPGYFVELSRRTAR